MNKADLRNNHRQFERHVERSEDFATRLLAAERVVRLEDKQRIAEATILRLSSYWEWFIDQELLDCININSRRLAQYLEVKHKHLNIEMCRAILFRGGYLDFRSVQAAKRFAKDILPDEVNPFRLIEPSTASKVDELFTIKNYLVHRSFAAKRALKKMYRKNYEIRIFQEPGRFLVAHRGRRLRSYIEALRRASTQMEAIV